ncbi:MAG: GGDEF domain-containing protein [Campylobacterota bacterium]|nr:GGDEF domain-containing protein [Campylobacterota bacterium]
MKLNYKLLSIPFLVLISLFYISFIFSSQIEILKKQVDNIYFGNFIAINRLHNINENFKNIIINKKDSKIFKNMIIDNWTKYKGQYKTNKERSIINIIDKKILKSFTNNSKSYYIYITEQVDLLTKHEIHSASIERKEFLKRYENMNNYLFYNQILIVVVLMFLLSFIIYYVIKNNKEVELLKDKYKEESITDGLTSLYNRKYFDETFTEIIDVSKNNSCSSFFVMIDIDYFKQYNDFYGHDAGDKALVSVARTINSLFIGDYEYSFRIGGEEFAILIFDNNIDTVKVKLDKLQENIKQLGIKHKASATALLTLSMGVLEINSSNYNLTNTELYKTADSKLYSSKENGRDQYTI